MGGPPFFVGDYDRALARLEFARKYLIYPPAEYLNIHRMLTLAQMGRLDEAKDLAFRTLRRVDDESKREHHVALTVLGTVAMLQKQFDVAQDYHRRLVSISPDSKHFQFKDLAQIYMEMGELGAAMDMINECLRLLNNPDYVNKLSGQTNFVSNLLGQAEAEKAWVLAAQSYHKEARILLHESASKVTNDYPALLAEYHEYVGRAYRAMNNLDEARRHLQKASELDPQGITGAEARDILATLDGGAT